MSVPFVSMYTVPCGDGQIYALVSGDRSEAHERLCADDSVWREAELLFEHRTVGAQDHWSIWLQKAA